VRLVGDFPPGVSSDAGLSSVQAALATWEGAGCGSPTLVLADEAGADLEIEWLEDWSAAGREASALGTTDVTYVGNTAEGFEISRARIVLNAQHYGWTTALVTDSSSRDVQAALTHEVGHALGLLHVCEPSGRDGAPRCSDDAAFSQSVMYPEYLGLSQRSLAPDDVAGLCALYDDSDHGCGVACDDRPESMTPDPNEGRTFARELGDPCVADEQCDSLLCGESGYCTSACDSLAVCPAGYRCLEGISSQCQAAAGVLGEACEAPEQCASQLCYVTTGAGVCTRPCTGEGDCPEDFECRGAGSQAVCTLTAGRGDVGCSFAPLDRHRSLHGLVGLLLILSSAVLGRIKRNAKETP
jgi:hypothetical protein